MGKKKNAPASVLVEGPLPESEALDGQVESVEEAQGESLGPSILPDSNDSSDEPSSDKQQVKTTSDEPFADHPKFDKFK
jgi:hypothetical protein